ncbi:hypothetical protein LUZ61_004228 [Rhynchospora tenuis]|uniref:Dirigent protein n=1 Tax=Rhynchospora tenuis TaxID=198213 RepID=A0AAD5ZME2_9POAL|nr:hypothetical protein LUZ61_004228 [Rhynchospora tenuis]
MEKSSSNLFKVTAVQNEVESRLYLHMENKGWGDVSSPNRPSHFGLFRVNDWPLYDGFGPSKKLIGRAHGTHVQSGVNSTIWYYHLSLIFHDDRFKDSSLQVTGNELSSGEWAIVGGTGELIRAQGTVSKKLVQEFSNGEKFIELNIRALYTPLKKAT